MTGELTSTKNFKAKKNMVEGMKGRKFFKKFADVVKDAKGCEKQMLRELQSEDELEELKKIFYLFLMMENDE